MKTKVDLLNIDPIITQSFTINLQDLKGLKGALNTQKLFKMIEQRILAKVEKKKRQFQDQIEEPSKHEVAVSARSAGEVPLMARAKTSQSVTKPMKLLTSEKWLQGID